jgi:hypothetical protein
MPNGGGSRPEFGTPPPRGGKSATIRKKALRERKPQTNGEDTGEAMQLQIVKECSLAAEKEAAQSRKPYSIVFTAPGRTSRA